MTIAEEKLMDAIIAAVESSGVTKAEVMNVLSSMLIVSAKNYGLAEEDVIKAMRGHWKDASEVLSQHRLRLQ